MQVYGCMLLVLEKTVELKLNTIKDLRRINDGPQLLSLHLRVPSRDARAICNLACPQPHTYRIGTYFMFREMPQREETSCH